MQGLKILDKHQTFKTLSKEAFGHAFKSLQRGTH